MFYEENVFSNVYLHHYISCLSSFMHSLSICMLVVKFQIFPRNFTMVIGLDKTDDFGLVDMTDWGS